jgi:hypothetical protein
MEPVQQDLVDYYSKDVISKAIAAAAVGREAVGIYASGHYDSRPNVIQFAGDVSQLAHKGITSFHISVERWRFPMQLANSATNSDNSSPTSSARYDTLRTGWDFVIDIDSKLGLEESTIAARLICELFAKYGITQFGLKFSGRRGWHLCLPWEALPKQIDYKPAEIGYPEIPRILSRFIRSRIAGPLMDELLKHRSLKDMLEALEVAPSELSPFFFVEVEQDWGARHLVRAPYSLNEKTWRVSLPIKPEQLAGFSPDMAKPETVMKLKESVNFFETQRGCAEGLVLDALDWWAAQKKEQKPVARKEIKWEQKISEDNFPPCIKLVLAGLKDGKKRSLFTLINFLRFANWSWQDVEARLFEWNAKNSPMLPRTTILGQLRWAMQQNRSINPANCSNEQFYKSIGICQPDNFCKNRTGEITIKNPISYPFRKMGVSGKTNSSTATQPNQNTENKLKAKSTVVMRGFSCDECNREFKSMRSLAAHKTRTHGG